MATGVLAEARRSNQIDTLTRESVGINECLDFIDGLLSRHELPEQTLTTTKAGLSRIKQRQNDPNVYLGVIGEFSSGKSSFINSLIRDDLLETNVIQATTSAATVMKHGQQLDVEVTFSDGEMKSFRKDGMNLWGRVIRLFSRYNIARDVNDITSFLRTVTANEEVSKNISMVSVLHPSKVLNDGLVIVDTPGTNAENPRHGKVARWVLDDICDAAIVIIPSNIPLSETLVTFLRRNLSESIHRCIFIVTKMDLIKREKDRQFLLSNIEQRVSKEFGVSAPVILGSSPLLVLETQVYEGTREIDSPLTEDTYKELLDQSLATEAKVGEVLARQRNLMQIERLLILLKTLLTGLSHDLKQMEEGYAKRHQALITNRIPDLDSFIEREKDRQSLELKEKTSDLTQRSKAAVEAVRDELLMCVKSVIYSATDKGTLSRKVKESLPPLTESYQSKLGERLSFVSESLAIATRQQVNEFEKEFSKLYASLATLGGLLSSSETAVIYNGPTSIAEAMGRDHDDLKDLVNKNQGQETSNILGSAGVGAVIGSFLLPGLGTIVGAAIGGFLGSLFGPSLEELQSEYWEKVELSILKAFGDSARETGARVESSRNRAIRDLHGVMDRYFDKYSTLVHQMIKRDEEEAANLTRKRSLISEDQSRLLKWQEQVTTVKVKIRELS